MAPKNSQQAVSPPLDTFVEDTALIEAAWDKETTPYDYVIVGSGAGGGPLAARLALAGKRVLIVEAGGDPKKANPSPAFPGSDPGEVNQIPGFHAAATEDPEMSWQFSVRHYADDLRQRKDAKYNQVPLDPNRPRQQPDKPLDSKYLDAPAGPPGRGKRGILYPRSSGIGGCTGHHAMIMATPNDRDWNGIADLTGDDSWRAEKMRGYFARLERCLYPAAYDNFLQNLLGVIYKAFRWLVLLFHPRGALDNGGHGFNGWQPTSFIDPNLVQTIVEKDKTFFNVLARTALSVLHDDQPLIAMFKRALFRLRIVQQLDPNDLNTRRLNERGGVFLIPLGIATQNAEKRCPDETDEAFRKRIAEQRKVFGRRAGVREFLLKTKAEKPNHLAIAQGYHVTRVIFAPAKADSPPRAIGIAAIKGKNLYEASPLQQSEVKPDSETEVKFFTRGEVILCGGAFNTPQLLMLSGIGNKAHLQEVSQRAGGRNACTLTAEGGDPLLDQDKKPQRIHLPGVGKNLQDRYEVTVIGEVEKDFSTLAGVSFVPGDANDPERRQWLQEKNGLYATNGGTLAVLQRSKGAEDNDPPDLFSFGAPAAFRGYYWNWSRQLFRPTITAAEDQRNLWSWVILKAYTRNHSGTVRLRTDDPFACPNICFDSFNEHAERIWDKLNEKKEQSAATGKPSLPWIESLARKIAHIRRDTERDVNGVLEAVRTMRQINSRNKQFVREIQPGPTLPEGSDELREWVKTQAWGHHASCTCRMGSDPWRGDPSKLSDRFAVLDSRFRVHGVDKLRVVDASVFPRIPGYFILTPIFMVSEKAADTLLEDAAAAVYPVKFEAMEAAAIRERRRKARLVASGMAASANANACVPPKDKEETIAEELGEPKEKKDGPGKIPGDTVGLAFSGGGIRSATFALGFLQALAERDRLRQVDFLSTVSGGGFTGSFLGRLFTRPNVEAATDPCGRVQDILKDSGSAPLWWLRTQANYIFATGMADVRKNLATYWRNVFTVHLVIGALLFASFGLLRGIAPSLPGMLSAPVGLSLFGSKLSPWWWLPALSVALAVVPASLGFWLAPRIGIRTPYPFFPLLAWIVLLGGLAAALGWPGATLLAIAGLAVLISSWFWQESARWKPPQGRQEGTGEYEGAVVRNRLTRSLGEMLFLFFGLLGWVVIDTFARAVASMGIGATLAAVVLALGPVLPLLRSLAQKAIQLATASKGKKGFSLAVLANAIGIPLAIFLLFVLDLLAHELFLKRPEWAWGTVIIAALFSLALGRAIAFLNLSSLSATYAARLVRTFLGASNAARIYGDETDDARDVQLAHPEDDVPFHKYHPEAQGGPLHLINVCVNETVEQASERQVRERKGLPMSIGPYGVSVGRRYFAEWVRPTMGPRQKILSSCGGSEQNSDHSATTALRAVPIVNNPNAFHVFGYRPEASEAEGCGEAARKAAPVESCSLGTWTAISGAAFNTGIGRGTTLPLAFFMGFINVRLGYWWDSGIPGSKRPGRYPRPFWRWLKGIPAMLFRMQSMLLSEWRGLFHGPSRRFWYLSDGGHFEVTGLYELLRRRVPFMIVTDGGEDPDYDWNDLAELIRAARMDFRAQIIWLEPPARRDVKSEKEDEWELFAAAMTATVEERQKRGVKVAENAEMTPPPWVKEWVNPKGVGALNEIRRKDSPRHAALARVTYDGSDDVSWILIVKPSLAPDLTEDILNYATSNEKFPQDPTIDQIFDDAQWESYRALGQQIGRKVLSK